MKVIHSDITTHPALQGLSYEEIKFLRSLAKIYVNTIVKIADENSVPVHPEVQRRSV